MVHTGCITILDHVQLLTCMQVTICINAAKLQFVYSSRTVGVGYVHRGLSNTMSTHMHRLGHTH